jgi:hypothetical protein
MLLCPPATLCGIALVGDQCALGCSVQVLALSWAYTQVERKADGGRTPYVATPADG